MVPIDPSPMPSPRPPPPSPTPERPRPPWPKESPISAPHMLPRALSGSLPRESSRPQTPSLDFSFLASLPSSLPHGAAGALGSPPLLSVVAVVDVAAAMGAEDGAGVVAGADRSEQ